MSATSSNIALVPNANLLLTGSTASRTLQITPVFAVAGASTITVSVQDALNTTTAAFTFTVSPNAAPTIVGLPSSTAFAENTAATLAFTVADDATAAGALVVTASSSNPALIPNGALVLGGSGASRTLTLTPQIDHEGQSTITLQVSDGDVSGSATMLVTVTSTGAPNAPTGLTATVNGLAVTFSWTAPATGPVPTFYVLEGGTALGATNLPVVSTGNTATTYSATLPPGGYFVRVRSANSGGTSGVSNEVAVGVTGGAQPPGAPGALVATVTGTAVRFDWQAPSIGGPLNEWRLEAGSAPGRIDRGVFSIGASARTVSGPAPAGTTYARLRGVGPGGAGPASNEVQFAVGATGCAAASDAPVLYPAAVAGPQVTLTWRAPVSGGVTGYALRAGTAPGLADLATNELGPVTAYSVPAPPGVYHVSLIAHSACGDSAISNPIVVTVGPPGTLARPANFRTQVIGSTVVLVWDAVAGAGSYLIEAGYAPGLSNAAILPFAATRFVAINVPRGTYYVRVRAVGAAGAGPLSEEIAVIVP